MGNLNCKECFGRDSSFKNEMLLAKISNNNQFDQNISRNRRDDQLKVLKLKEIENHINNERNINSIPPKLFESKKQKKVSYNTLRKEERDNNNLLKTELNKIREINVDKSNSDDLSKIIESQKEKIIAQEKLIEEYKYKQNLLEKWQEQLEQTQTKIREQQSLLNLQGIENNKTYMIPYITQNDEDIENNEIIKTSPTDMTGYKKKLLPSKSTPKLQIGIRNIKNDYNFLNLDKFERTLETKSNFNNERIYQNDEGQIEENDNYERVDDFDEEDDDKINQQRQSQRFKIETYEPIEVGNKNENDEIIKDYKKNENLFLEPRDSTKLNQKKGSIPKSNYNKKNTKKIYDKMNKRDKGPRDSGNSGIKINFRGTFENKNMNNINIGPRDSKRKNNNEFNYNMDNIEIPYIIDNNDVIGKNKIKNNNDDDEVKEVLIEQQEQFNNEQKNMNIFKNNNNIYIPNDYFFNQQQESPKFNSRYNESMNSSMQNEENIEMKTEIGKYRNAETYGPYLNEADDINVVISADHINYNRDIQGQEQINKDLDNEYYINNINDVEIIDNNNTGNPLIYDDNKINMNFFNNKNEYYQEQSSNN
jgi:hypothetical protein